MVQILPPAQRRPSFGEQLGATLGSSFSQGVAKSQEMKRELEKERQKQQMKFQLRKDLFSTVEPREEQPSEASVSQDSLVEPKTPSSKPKEKHYPQQTIDKFIIAGDVQTARAMQEHNKTLDKRADFDRKQEFETKKFHHQESGKFHESLQEEVKAAELKNRALQKQMNKIGDVSWKDKIVSNVLGGTRWENLFKSKDAQEFDAYSLPQLAGLRQLLGGVLSDSDIRLIMQKVVTASKDPQANEAIGEWLMTENNAIIQKGKIAEELIQKNKGFRPADFRGEIDRIYNEQYGDQIRQIADRVMSLKDDPTKAAMFRRKVPPKTPLNDQTIDMYLDMADEDVDEAMRMAEEDGYDISNN